MGIQPKKGSNQRNTVKYMDDCPYCGGPVNDYPSILKFECSFCGFTYPCDDEPMDECQREFRHMLALIFVAPILLIFIPIFPSLENLLLILTAIITVYLFIKIFISIME
jgi:hypothetical protein